MTHNLDSGGAKVLRTSILRAPITRPGRSRTPKHNIIFLDWEKAFDRISHHRLLEALERMKIDAKMINNIQVLYEHPFFKTIHNTEESEWKKQHSGIRQGCPLSPGPYLFILMINVLFFDVRRKNNDAFFQKTVNNITFQEVLYADDTLVIAKNTQTANDYLRYIEEKSEYTT